MNTKLKICISRLTTLEADYPGRNHDVAALRSALAPRVATLREASEKAPHLLLTEVFIRIGNEALLIAGALDALALEPEPALTAQIAVRNAH